MRTHQATTVLLAVTDRQGYSPLQAVRHAGDAMTLDALRDAVDAAIDAYGGDAYVVTDTGDRYGARFGVLDVYRDTFVPADDDDEGGY